ncbi:MAG: YajQ family cyclic di-GMP-binding protein [Elusimicrobiota bacterium]
MADNFSFDIVSEVNLQEVDNAVNQALKEISQRFDFKNSTATINFSRTEKKLTLVAENEFRLKALREVLFMRLASRGISPKSLDVKPFEGSAGMTVRQTIELIVGIPKEKARELVKIIKDLNLRVQVQIEDTKVRVSCQKKDVLQTVIAKLRASAFSLPLQFNNYR